MVSSRRRFMSFRIEVMSFCIYDKIGYPKFISWSVCTVFEFIEAYLTRTIPNPTKTRLKDRGCSKMNILWGYSSNEPFRGTQLPSSAQA